MSDLTDRLINASDLIDWILECYPDWCVGDVRSIVNHIDEMPSVTPTHPTPSNTLGALDCVERQAAMKIRFSSGFDHDGILFVPYRDVEEHLKELPSVQSEQKWETCFDCPLSHGCPKINGCTNGQTMEYASEVPDDCPISVQPRKGKISYTEFCEELWGQSSICSLCGCSWQIAKDGDDNFCPNCGADMKEGDTDD